MPSKQCCARYSVFAFGFLVCGIWYGMIYHSEPSKEKVMETVVLVILFGIMLSYICYFIYGDIKKLIQKLRAGQRQPEIDMQEEESSDSAEGDGEPGLPNIPPPQGGALAGL